MLLSFLAYLCDEHRRGQQHGRGPDHAEGPPAVGQSAQGTGLQGENDHDEPEKVFIILPKLLLKLDRIAVRIKAFFSF